MNAQIDEQRVLGILMSFPEMCAEVNAEWFTNKVNRRIFLAIRDTGSGEISALVENIRASDEGARYMLGLSELCWAPGNLHAFLESMRARCENAAYAISVKKLVSSSKGSGLFANILKGESNEASEVRA